MINSKRACFDTSRNAASALHVLRIEGFHVLVKKRLCRRNRLPSSSGEIFRPRLQQKKKGETRSTGVLSIVQRDNPRGGESLLAGRSNEGRKKRNRAPLAVKKRPRVPPLEAPSPPEQKKKRGKKRDDSNVGRITLPLLI